MLRTDVGAGWFEKIKETLHADSWLADLDLSLDTLLYSGLYGACGFLLGFSLKKYGRAMIGLSLVCVLVLFFLYSFNIITFDFIRLKELVGLAPTTTAQSLFQLLYEWMRDNKMMSIGSILGFVIGYIVG